VTVDEGWRFGVDVLKDLEALGVKGVVDTCRMIPEQGLRALMHNGKGKVLGNGALYKKATTSVASRDTITFLPARRTLTLEEFKYAFESRRQTPAIAGEAFLQLFHCNA
jgi:hypothetical protein